MSPVQRRLAISPNPHEFAQSPKVQFWQALHQAEEADKRDVGEAAKGRVASRSNIIAGVALVIAAVAARKEIAELLSSITEALGRWFGH